MNSGKQEMTYKSMGSRRRLSCRKLKEDSDISVALEMRKNLEIDKN